MSPSDLHTTPVFEAVNGETIRGRLANGGRPGRPGKASLIRATQPGFQHLQPLRFVSVPIILSGYSRFVTSCGPCFDTGTSSKRLPPSRLNSLPLPSVTRQELSERPASERVSDTSLLLPAFSEKKLRRKMVMRPLTCEIFWEPVDFGVELGALTPLGANPSESGTESGRLNNLPTEPQSSALEISGCHPQISPLMSSMLSSFSTSSAAKSGTSLTTTGSDLQTPNGLQSSTQALRSDSQVIGLTCDEMRPKTLQFNGVPIIQPGLNPFQNKSLDHTVQPQTMTMEQLTNRLSYLEMPFNPSFFDQIRHSNSISPADTVRFGRALVHALNMQVADTRHVLEAKEDVSYWSMSETEAEDEGEYSD
ncbi:hypothetical protein CROQUDRAFT_721807 [Cronartium quercuum f. sp. fusiforme G11]|uniref:Uncharacterized protein n=1 Tax=Cronartium quercuum f. sp. fusiforme G11 TaxID=708437 RepID=A0A9P6NLJ7_9BASI|nr:hypothetical protein CROQUDRAFT_721807 [Cronartium quercuum f. sp. fusiforme G11]